MRRLAFDGRWVHVRFAVDKMALRHKYLQVLRNSPVDTVPPMLQIFFIYMLLLPNGQTAEAWEPPERNALSGVDEH
jgi:hypothetical protein